MRSELVLSHFRGKVFLGFLNLLRLNVTVAAAGRAVVLRLISIFLFCEYVSCLNSLQVDIRVPVPVEAFWYVDSGAVRIARLGSKYVTEGLAAVDVLALVSLHHELQLYLYGLLCFLCT